MGIDFEKDIGKTIALAGLLHDIGKFMNRTSKHFDFVEKKAHPFLSKLFVESLEKRNIIKENKILKTLVQRHHEDNRIDGELLVQNIENETEKKIAYILSKADNYSSSEREEIKDENRGKYKTNALHNIFETIFNKNAKQSYLLSKFDPKNIFSKKGDNLLSESYDLYYKKFSQELNEIIESETYEELFNKLFFIFEKYLWCIPSDTREENRVISLFDHLKTTSAIALASYRYHIENDDFVNKNINSSKLEKFTLIGGDISGIQNYIYGIPSTDKIAKRLRARSFTIRLLTDIVSYKIINELELTIANNVISAGGKFFIIAANTDRTKRKLKEIKEEINEWLYSDYQAEMFFNLEWLDACGDDLGKDFDSAYDAINDKLDLAKRKKYDDFILRKPVIDKNYEGTQLCGVCRKYWKKVDDDACEFCKSDEKMGKWLTKTKFLAFYKEKPDDSRIISFFEKGKYYVSFLYESDETKTNSIKPFLLINIFDNKILSNYPAGFKYYAGYVPKYDNLEEYQKFGQNEEKEVSEKIVKDIPKTFEAIAKKSHGVSNLAILKADVDNLGMIFSLGLKGKDKKVSISKISTMSRMLDGFFSGWIQNEFIKNPKQIIRLNDRQIALDMSNNYVVYSGGDDLMIVGPWDELILTSKYINEKFREFVGENNRITLSAGITLCHHKEPISHTSEKVSIEEERAKNAGKNCLAVFGKVVKWKDFDRVFDLGEFIMSNMNRQNDKGNYIYSQSFVYRMLKYAEMAEKYAITEDGKHLKYVSSFMYDIGRNLLPIIKNEGESLEDTMNKPEIKKLMQIFNSDENYGQITEEDFLAEYMRVSLNWAVRKNRNEGGN